MMQSILWNVCRTSSFVCRMHGACLAWTTTQSLNAICVCPGYVTSSICLGCVQAKNVYRRTGIVLRDNLKIENLLWSLTGLGRNSYTSTYTRTGISRNLMSLLHCRIRFYKPQLTLTAVILFILTKHVWTSSRYFLNSSIDQEIICLWDKAE